MKKTKKVMLVFLLLLWGMENSILAQNTDNNLANITPRTPEASALIRSINYPVNYSTGLPQINIPLYEIKSGDITIPITLSYHASGIKVVDESGRIASNWSLTAEPSISRIVRGNPDEESYSGYLHNNDTQSDDLQYKIHLANGLREEEPDEFYYKLLDKSGAFYFSRKTRSNENSKVVCIPYEPIDILFKNEDYFTITNEDGIIYTFDKKEEDYTSKLYTCNWKASQIKSAKTGRIISFTYNSRNFRKLATASSCVLIEDYPDMELLALLGQK